LLQEGTDLKYGARHLKRAIERHVVYPLASLLATEQVKLGDALRIDWNEAEGRLVFQREREGAVVPVPAPQPKVAALARRAASGRPAGIPSTAVAGEV